VDGGLLGGRFAVLYDALILIDVPLNMAPNAEEFGQLRRH